MIDLKFIDENTYNNAIKTELIYKQLQNTIKAPHFVFYVKDQLIKKYGERIVEEGGLKVTTSLDWDLQQKAELAVKEEVDKVSKQLNITNGSSVILDTNTGEILSMVGSKDFFDKTIDGEVNVATRLRQPGSSIKPLVFAAAFMKNYTCTNATAGRHLSSRIFYSITAMRKNWWIFLMNNP